jgi:glucose-1-phosphatase
MPPKFLYFDLGNVLLGFCHDRMCRQMADVAGVKPEVVREFLFADQGPDCPQWRYECGQMNSDDYYDHFCQRTGTQPHRAALEHAACDIFWPLEPTLDLVRALSAAGNRLGLLSNINALHWRFVTGGRFSGLALPSEASGFFQCAVLSFEAGAMKPDARIYDAAAKLAGVRPGEVFFVDDRPENVAGARAAGLDAVTYVDAAKFADDLRSREVQGI